ncbi:MAG: flagellar basal-body rod protein FlgF [Rickettsiales bacterium]
MPHTPYILTSRKIGLFNSLARLSDNIANAETAGYKRESNIFRSLVVSPPSGASAASQDFSIIRKVQRDFGQGPLKQTDRALDFALQGEGFFVVNTPLGERYTRAGNFVLDAGGRLVTKEGYPVSSEGGGDITFNPEDSDISVRENGGVYANGAERGVVRIVTFADLDALRRTGQGLYAADQSPGAPDPSTRMMQGMLESSNVDTVTETAKLIELSRSIEDIKQSESSEHRRLLDAVRRLGQVRQ